MVDSVRQIHGLNEFAFGLGTDLEIRGNNVKDLITKFFYRDSNLCFHILLHVDGGETVFFREYVDYAEYKKAFSDLQQAKLNNGLIHVQKKKLTSGEPLAKVA